MKVKIKYFFSSSFTYSLASFLCARLARAIEPASRTEDSLSSNFLQSSATHFISIYSIFPISMKLIYARLAADNSLILKKKMKEIFYKYNYVVFYLPYNSDC